jgi:ribose 5-phosphate isomerase A
MNQDALKGAAAEAAIDLVLPRLSRETIIGIGTGTTTNRFIDALARHRHMFDAAVASSAASANRLRAHGIAVIDLNSAPDVLVYVDGADEVNPARQLMKGGGGALTREKIIATTAREFICIVDESKLVNQLGQFPLPVEVIPMARGLAARTLAAMGGQPVYREGVITDNGNIVLDVHGLDLSDPLAMESRINDIVGVVCNGIFAARPADIVIVAGANGVRQV